MNEQQIRDLVRQGLESKAKQQAEQQAEQEGEAAPALTAQQLLEALKRRR